MSTDSVTFTAIEADVLAVLLEMVDEPADPEARRALKRIKRKLELRQS